jgi:hypothetical protein
MNAADEVLKVAAIAKGSQATPEEKAQWVKRFAQSGLSLRKFSAQNSLAPMTLWRWVNQGRKQAVGRTDCAAPAFTEVKVWPGRESVPWVAEWNLPNGAVLRVSKDVPAALLEQLLRVC